MWTSRSVALDAPGRTETPLRRWGPRQGSAALAQLVERLTRNEKVAGSIPAGGPSTSLQIGGSGAWLRRMGLD